MALSATAAHHRARIAALSRDRAADDPEIICARRDLAAARLADHVERVIADAPPLTGEQRAHIAALLSVGPRPQEAHADLGIADTSPNEVGGEV